MPEPITPPEQQTATPNPMPVEAAQPAAQPPDLGAPRPMTQPQQLAVPPVASPQAEDEQSYSTLGRIAHSLMGKQVDYRANPETGQVERVVTARKPGDFFKSILAGAILGGALGAKEETFGGAMAVGGAGVIEKGKQEEEAKYQRARTGMADVYAAREEQRKVAGEERQKKAFATEEQVRKAQIAQANAATMRENVLTQGASWDLHAKQSEAGRLKAAPYKIAGIQPVYEDVGESAMHDLLKKKPDAGLLDWEPTGTHAVRMPDGEISYEQTYSAYDPNKKVRMTPELIKLYKEAGMDKYYPNWDTVVTPGKELTPEQFLGLKAQYQTLANEDFDRQKRKSDLDTASANIGRAKAETAKYWADIATEKTAKTKTEQSEKAMNQWNTLVSDAKKAGKPITSKEAFEQLSPGDQTIIGESLRGLGNQITTAMSAVSKKIEQEQFSTGGVSPATQQEADDLVKQLSAITQLTTQQFMGPETAPSGIDEAKINRVLSLIKDLPPDQQKIQIQESTSLTEEEKQEILRRTQSSTAPTRKVGLEELPPTTLSPNPYGP